MSIKRNVLQKEKLLKAVRRRNGKVSNHNFETKTLVPVQPLVSNQQSELDNRAKHIAHNKEMRIEREMKQ